MQFQMNPSLALGKWKVIEKVSQGDSSAGSKCKPDQSYLYQGKIFLFTLGISRIKRSSQD